MNRVQLGTIPQLLVLENYDDTVLEFLAGSMELEGTKGDLKLRKSQGDDMQAVLFKGSVQLDTLFSVLNTQNTDHGSGMELSFSIRDDERVKYPSYNVF